ncbi:MAG: hypothetical protein Q8Q15_01410, partial [bacterium]|nr:hypothetical protein [bacterium]
VGRSGFPGSLVLPHLYLRLECADDIRGVGQDLSNLESDLDKLAAHEPFSEYPNLDAPDEEIRA